MQDPFGALDNVLRQAGYSSTMPRRVVFQSLLIQSPQTLHELTASVTGLSDRSSVYRTVALYEKLGIINRLQIGWKYKIELSDRFASHHHHITCTSCGSVASLNDTPNIEHELQLLAQSVSYRLSGHQLELRGTCAACANKLSFN